ncbi:hypothetical protein PVNG_02444 [Plasmodium vivax North Korean]|uniref:SLC41A/MgtE integral membrane domain-containing protein n=1 Tax=Plasmodium vivax North Korean TaxID=1035514 RepID=A0A0J9TMB9_PLAVI|nr:hypothetical protein PVNG_02444 [Plasmodium vivax North Korean]
MIPLITDMCGNSGSQTAASIIQSFASSELKSRDFFPILRKELKIAVIVGGIIAILNFLRLLIYFSIFPMTTEKLKNSVSQYNLSLMGILGSAISSISLFLVIVLSKVVGVVIPYAAYKSRRDPAALTTPVLTTFLDAIGTLIFFSIGGLIVFYFLYRKSRDPRYKFLESPLSRHIIEESKFEDYLEEILQKKHGFDSIDSIKHGFSKHLQDFSIGNNFSSSIMRSFI